MWHDRFSCKADVTCGDKGMIEIKSWSPVDPIDVRCPECDVFAAIYLPSEGVIRCDNCPVDDDVSYTQPRVLSVVVRV